MIQTNLFRVMNAVRFKQAFAESPLYLIFGGADPWDDDNDPPDPVPTDTTIDDAFCAVKAEVLWVKEDNAGPIYYQDADNVTRRFLEITTFEDMLDEMSTFVIMTAETTGANLGVEAFRKLGFASGLIPVAGHEADDFLSAANVDEWGNVECLEFRKPATILNAGVYGGTGILEY